jgi:hypothetical protein
MRITLAARVAIALTVILFGLSVLPASTAVVYSNFGTGDSYVSNQGWTLSGQLAYGFDQHGTYNVACSFTPTSSYSLDKIELAAMNTKQNIHLNIYLMSDNAGVPGTALEQLSIAIDGLSAELPTLIVQANSVSHPVMTKDQLYWLVACPATDTTWTGWCKNSQGASGLAFLNPDYDKVWTNHPSPYVQGAFRISGTSAPEPSSLFALLTGIGGLGGMTWRRRR